MVKQRRKDSLKKYSLGAYAPGAKNAGSKAVEDVHRFAKELGFKLLMPGHKNRILRYIFQVLSVLRIRNRSLILVQYPMMRSKTLKSIRRFKRNVKMIGFIHDLPSIRFGNYDVAIDIKNLSYFDILVIHNPKMANRLKTLGVAIPMISLEVFDYYHGCVSETDSRNINDMAFAGNLGKSVFLNHIKELDINIKFILYGIGLSQEIEALSNVDYRGSFMADELPMHLEGGFGLVWDGDSINTCSGLLGEYTRINNPHKMSLYLSTGMPVIVWKESAIATFVENEQIGFCVDSLSQIPENITKMSEEIYRAFCGNAKSVGEKLKRGYYTNRALNQCIDCLKEGA